MSSFPKAAALMWAFLMWTAPVLADTTATAQESSASAPSSSAPAAAEPAAAPAGALSAEVLKAHYAKITAFTAEADQEKKAAFLARPLKSEVVMSMKDGRIEWKTLKPVVSSIAIDADGIHLESGGASGAGEALKNAGKDPRAAAFIGFLRSLFALDFPAIEKDFALTFSGNAMQARPRETSSLGAMIRGIDLEFAPDLALRKVVVETKDETTTLIFKTFVPAANP